MRVFDNERLALYNRLGTRLISFDFSNYNNTEIKICKRHMYAEDIQQFTPTNTAVEVEGVNSYVSNRVEGLNKHGHKLNPTKT